jgi:hypothetical protein
MNAPGPLLEALGPLVPAASVADLPRGFTISYLFLLSGRRTVMKSVSDQLIGPDPGRLQKRR